ncbi:erythromycin esterase family protein [Paractinoplanes atraurantiacus]|uniref:Erythromycin esterase homolog n=1 Tax=Paractinoplanes atraurantiacus TaxID=1036182 RepID=A0A285H4I2_9ACTN|nr:erythromycin esterase family protein [Actinoplanes atraurantiacus]SNY29676.1 Erythromycin esterase homolog [Actinoplanes atraurantiacus]
MTDDVMALLPERPRLLALGEPTHFEDSLLRVRNDLFRRLVEREGFRAIAIESDCLMGLLVDDYVVHGAGTLDDVMRRGFSHEFGTMAGNRELVRWLHAYNRSRPLPERVHFAGFDGPLEITGGASPREALLGLHGLLGDKPCTVAELDRLIGDDERWPNPDAMMDPSQSVGRTPEARQLRLLADEMVALLEAESPAKDEMDRGRLYGRTATGLLLYHHWMADPSPARLTRVLGQRAAMMAANLLALTQQHGPIMAFAQNSHLQRAKSSIRLGGPLLHWWSAGAIVAAQLGSDYAFVATALGTIRHRGVETPPINTIEGLLYVRTGDHFIVDPRKLPADAEKRESPWFGYAPLDPAHLPEIDAIVYVKDAIVE